MKASRLVATTITLAFLFISFSVPAYAQFTSGLTGTVTDETGAAISGAKIVINSDAHAPGEVAYEFDAAVALVKEVGYGETARFTKRFRTMVALTERTCQ